MKSEDFGNLYDYSLTVEQNLEVFKTYGVNTTFKTLKVWLDQNSIPYTTDKQVRNEYVVKLYEEDNTKSSREIEKICKENGVDVNYRTVQRILARYRKSLE